MVRFAFEILRIYQTSVKLTQFISSENCIEANENLWHMHAGKSKTIRSLHSFGVKSCLKSLLFRLSGNRFLCWNFLRFIENVLSLTPFLLLKPTVNENCRE